MNMDSSKSSANSSHGVRLSVLNEHKPGVPWNGPKVAPVSAWSQVQPFPKSSGCSMSSLKFIMGNSLPFINPELSKLSSDKLAGSSSSLSIIHLQLGTGDGGLGKGTSGEGGVGEYESGDSGDHKAGSGDSGACKAGPSNAILCSGDDKPLAPIANLF